MTATSPSPLVRDSLGREYPALPTVYSEVWVMPRQKPRAGRVGRALLRALAAIGLVATVLTLCALVRS